MKNRNNALVRDEVLLAFHETCEKPTAEEIISWTNQYPEYAEDIREHAAIALDIAASEKNAQDQIAERDLNISFSHALNGLSAGDREQKALSSTNDSASFHEIIAAHGKTIASLANEIGGMIGIGRDVVAALANGGMAPPVGPKFKKAVMTALSLSSEAFDHKLSIALANPRVGMAKSKVAPKLNQRSYEEIIRASDMDTSQTQYWLSED
ncbi:hypothetical protein V8G57_11515 [Collimonas sp. H4R21]|uniref:Uncharacterized protein n=1 Tax=Collimonas rhizosphaerae TaxID=3126357 RepID=A0ABU9PVI2_9BURK